MPGVSERDAAPGPFEEAFADLSLQRLDAGGDRRLSKKQGFCRSAERAVVRYLDEGFELGEFQMVSSRGSPGGVV